MCVRLGRREDRAQISHTALGFDVPRVRWPPRGRSRGNAVWNRPVQLAYLDRARFFRSAATPFSGAASRAPSAKMRRTPARCPTSSASPGGASSPRQMTPCAPRVGNAAASPRPSCGRRRGSRRSRSGVVGRRSRSVSAAGTPARAACGPTSSSARRAGSGSQPRRRACRGPLHSRVSRHALKGQDPESRRELRERENRERRAGMRNPAWTVQEHPESRVAFGPARGAFVMVCAGEGLSATCDECPPRRSG